MPDLRPDPDLGFVSRAWRESGTLRVPLGTVDLPLEQRRETLVLDLSGAGGNFALVGGPQTGKSTALRTIVQALSLTYTPQEVQFYVMDFGGGTFAGFANAPHVAGIATRDTEEVRTRMLAEIAAIMDDRERYFRAHGIDSMDTYRRGRLEGRYDDGYGRRVPGDRRLGRAALRVRRPGPHGDDDDEPRPVAGRSPHRVGRPLDGHPFGGAGHLRFAPGAAHGEPEGVDR